MTLSEVLVLPDVPRSLLFLDSAGLLFADSPLMERGCQQTFRLYANHLCPRNDICLFHGFVHFYGLKMSLSLLHHHFLSVDDVHALRGLFHAAACHVVDHGSVLLVAHCSLNTRSLVVVVNIEA